MRTLARAESRSWEVRLLAVGLAGENLPYDHCGEVASIFGYVRDSIRYVRDIRGAETVQAPRFTLRQGSGDCDDKATLLAALLQAVGYPVRFVLARTDSRRPDAFSHVYVQALVPPGCWLSLDPTPLWATVGWEPPQFGRPEKIGG